MRAIRTTTISILALGLLAGSAVGVVAQDEPSMDGAEVTGDAVFLAQITEGTIEEAPPLYAGDNVAARQRWSASDPRLDGVVTFTINWRADTDSGININAATYELTNDAGSWVGDARGYIGGTIGEVVSVALSGRDGYAGLSAIVVMESATTEANAWDLSGVIVPGELPEVPAPYAAE